MRHRSNPTLDSELQGGTRHRGSHLALKAYRLGDAAELTFVTALVAHGKVHSSSAASQNTNTGSSIVGLMKISTVLSLDETGG